MHILIQKHFKFSNMYNIKIPAFNFARKRVMPNIHNPLAEKMKLDKMLNYAKLGLSKFDSYYAQFV